MPRPRMLRTTVFPYHVCARSNNKDWFYLPIHTMDHIFAELVQVMVDRYQVQLHSFVLMSNHFHCLLSTPEANLSDAMLYLMREVSREVNRRTGRINHVFGGSYKWSLIAHRRKYEHAFKYVYRNPVEAGLSKTVESYPFSTLNPTLGTAVGNLPVVDAVFERRGVMDLRLSERVNWLNEPYAEYERRCVQLALRRARFQIRQTNLSRSLIEKLG